MKKAAIAAVGILTAVSMLTGFKPADQSKLTEIDMSVSVQPGMRIAVVSKTTKGQFWKMIHEGMDAGISAVNETYGFKKGDKISMTFEGADNEEQVETQINTIDAVLSENPDVLCLSVSDMNSCQAQLEMAQENGIPVVVFDANVTDADLVTAFRATDNVEIGREAAEELAEALGEQGEILVFSAQEKTESIQNRMQGFCETLEEYPELIIDAIYYSDQVDNMSDTIAEAFETYPEVSGVFCTNADVADLYLDFDREIREGVAMVGVDATTKQQEAIKNGEELCVISQNPIMIGYETILTAVYAAMQEEGESDITIEKNILLPPQKIHIGNLYNPMNHYYLYTE